MIQNQKTTPLHPPHWTWVLVLPLFHLFSPLRLSWPLCSDHNSPHMSSPSLDTAANLNTQRLWSHVHTRWICKPIRAWMRKNLEDNKPCVDLHAWLFLSIYVCQWIWVCVVKGFQRHTWCRISKVTCMFTCSGGLFLILRSSSRLNW